MSMYVSKSLLKLSLILISLCFEFECIAQKDSIFTCFNSQEIHFPLNGNDFSGNKIIKQEKKLNALYYVYKDKYSFWYKFIADKDMTINFSVSPTNGTDRYHAVAFEYSGSDFCDKLINEHYPPLNLVRAPIFGEDGTIVYRNTIEAQQGNTFYISVLSLNRDDCGHFLYIEAGGEHLSFHAIHRPCYDFVFLEVPDFSTAKIPVVDIDTQLNFERQEEADQKNSTDTLLKVQQVSANVKNVEEKQEPTSKTLPVPENAYAAIESIELQSRDENIVSKGDKLVLNQVFFYNNTYAFKPEATEELDQLFSFLQANPSVEIEIQGHTANNTDEIRPDPNFKSQGPEWNFKGSAFELSEKRAEAVRTYLTEKGIEKRRLRAEGYGDTQKRVPNATSFEDFEKNMRVEALVTQE